MSQTAINPKDCPKYLPPDNPARVARDCHIINQAAKGLSPAKIAETTPISRRQIANILSDDDAKAKLQAIIYKHIQATDSIQDVLISKATDPENTDNMKAITEHNKIIGISGSHTQNIHIEKLYQQNNALSLSPDVLRLLTGAGYEAPIEIPGYDDEA